LHVYDDFRFRDICRNFGDTIGSAAVIFVGENCFNTARGNGVSNLLAIGRDYHTMNVTSRASALRDPADHRLSGDFDESFSWETCRTKAGWNNGNRVIHGVTA
jgi:hypothetical protein